ncbi:sigma 54-interacting transcriptional regulator [Bacillus sp. HU-1818]|uniref:sigma 54-interacting transcriptional regulator n=1 Tax=Bacillus TaxID=1386 RepID=UPI001238697F|nr:MULTISPECIES: sigma 54-interacting transcriptional regulator [Bacillus]KAA6455189.1 AAA family ATPase [Bacillus atrophaeus]MCI3196860.1 sigma 54-interacting transcriptional regulator [Bacillus sp. HU-1818]
MNTAAHNLSFQNLIGEHKAFLEAKRIAMQFASSDLPVLITGKVGTGKEHFAAAIHHKSARKNELFISINCSTQSEERLEHELFGSDGAIQKAARGTLFLDEIWSLPRGIQDQLLRTVDSQPAADGHARFICATSIPLTDIIEKKQFRQDLFYRLNILSLSLPALSERKSDIPLLIQYFLSHTGHHLHIDPSVYPLLEQHPFEGNVRELKNTADYMAAVSSGSTIHPHDVPPDIQNGLLAKSSKKKSKLLTLMEKEEFIFILESVKALNEKGEPASRRILSELSKDTNTDLTPQQVRNRLDYLEKKDYVSKSRGRAGTKITMEGLDFLHSLQKQMIQ